MAIDKKLIDQLLTDYKKPEDIIGKNGLLKQLTKAVLERALEAEMSEHLGYEKHDPAGQHQVKVAMARKLAVHLYWMWRQGRDYGQFKKLGSQGRKLSSHPAVVTEGSTR